jgi:hypothetical protein
VNFETSLGGKLDLSQPKLTGLCTLMERDYTLVVGGTTSSPGACPLQLLNLQRGGRRDGGGKEKVREAAGRGGEGGGSGSGNGLTRKRSICSRSNGWA